tara:strand:- start:1108 stop:1272 length:165 start_codon:yes stop_codon:yes gene_type:complete
MIDLTYKKPQTNKDYIIKEVLTKLNKDNYISKIEEKELRKLKLNTLLIMLDKLK